MTLRLFIYGILWTNFIAHPPKAAAQSVDSSHLVRVLTVNIFHGESSLGDSNLDRLADLIRYTRPDLVALQEVDFRTHRAGGKDLVTELGYRTGMQAIFGKAMAFQGGEYGEGVLSKYSFLRTEQHALPALAGHEPRMAQEVWVVLPSGDTVSFTGTHLDHLNDPTDRIAQVRRLNERYQSLAHPAILAGDLNAVPDSEPIRILRRQWTPVSADNPAPTFSSSDPQKKIDYILYRPAARWRVHEQRVLCDPITTDHCAFFAVLELLD